MSMFRYNSVPISISINQSTLLSIYLPAYIYIGVYTRMYACVYIYIHTHIYIYMCHCYASQTCSSLFNPNYFVNRVPAGTNETEAE